MSSITLSPLYGPEGLPQSADIMQDMIGDCGLLATLGSIAELQPGLIQKNIGVDLTAGAFVVTLQGPAAVATSYGAWSQAVQMLWGQGASAEPAPHVPTLITVTPAELADNIARHGGSTLDNRSDGGGAAWPAVIETAVAKMYDSDPGDGLGEGYRYIDGMLPDEALPLFGIDIDPCASFYSGGPAQPSASGTTEKVYADLSAALANKQPVVLGTANQANVRSGGQGYLGDLLSWLAPRAPQPPALFDGLRDKHAFSVVGVHRSSSGEAIVDLRDPHGSSVVRSSSGEVVDVELADRSVPVHVLLAAHDVLWFGRPAFAVPGEAQKAAACGVVDTLPAK